MTGARYSSAAPRFSPLSLQERTPTARPVSTRISVTSRFTQTLPPAASTTTWTLSAIDPGPTRRVVGAPEIVVHDHGMDCERALGGWQSVIAPLRGEHSSQERIPEACVEITPCRVVEVATVPPCSRAERPTQRDPRVVVKRHAGEGVRGLLNIAEVTPDRRNQIGRAHALTPV